MRFFLLLGAGLVCCTAAGADEIPPAKTEKNPAVDASNAFACDLYKKLAEEKAGKNVFFSPYSISSALGMALEGARGDTAREMGDVLCLPKDLSQANGLQPWRTAPYGQGLAEVARRLAGGDDKKVELARRQVETMRVQLARLNMQLRGEQRPRDYRELQKLSTEAENLASAINTQSQQIDQFDLRVANALWGEKSHPFNKNYLEAVDRLYGSGHLRLADFKNDYPAERIAINRWVEQQTNDRIKDLLPELAPAESRLLRLVLVNAIYFRGEWLAPFDVKATSTEPFLLPDGQRRPVPMMHARNGVTRYAAFNGDGSFFKSPYAIAVNAGVAKAYPDRDGFLVAELPVRGDRLSMVLLAPQRVDGLADLEARLTGDNVARWLAKLEQRTVQVAVPRFKMETDYSLVDALDKLGMKKAFQPRFADFTAMSTSSNPDDRLSISRIVHKAFVEVNEKGAEAAAATVVFAPKSEAKGDETVPFVPDFRADRPFLFLIRARESGMILFVGRMTQPL